MSYNKLARILGIAIVFIIALMIAVLHYCRVVEVMESLANLWYIVMGALLAIAVQLIIAPQRLIGVPHDFGLSPLEQRLLQGFLSPKYTHLVIHYSQRKDTAEKPSVPYYLVNSKNNQAFWVSGQIRVLAKLYIIEGVTHKGKDDVLKYLKDNKITLNPRYPKDDSELSLG